MHGHPLLAGMLGQIESLERLARELRVPLLSGQATALRQGLIALMEERASLEEAAMLARLKTERAGRALQENRRRHEDGMRAFMRLRQGYSLAATLRDLKDLGGVLERLRALFRVELLRLVPEAQLAPYLPTGWPVLPARALDDLAARLHGRVYVGPCAGLPDGVLDAREQRRLGSCFVYLLQDRYNDAGCSGLAILADANPQRYLPEMATDYLEHFCDILGDAVVSVGDRRRAEELREDVERITRHDLKSPLSAVLTIPQLMLDDQNITARQKDMLHLMLEAGRRMQSMITLSLSLYRMERGSYELSPVELDAAQLVRSIWEESGAPYRGAHMELAVTASEEPFLIQGEELLCYTMLANLIKNALEASSPGDPVRVDLTRGQGVAVIEVTNTRDVPEEVRPVFFEKYATAGKPGGTGLGAYTARLIARVHGGDVELVTGGGEGTRVRVTLPDAR